MYRKWMKRFFDIILSFCAIIVLCPFSLIIFLLVSIFLGRPAIFRQVRPGLYGKPFTLLKFRSMTSTTDSNGELLPDAERITRFGQVIRALSLDELPQLVNVLKGEMSLIGPRPLLMEYLPLYTQRQLRRHEVRPGVTGWAQVNGRNALSWNEKFELDIWYVENVTFMTDIKIVWMTFRQLVRKNEINYAGHTTMPKFEGQTSNIEV